MARGFGKLLVMPILATLVCGLCPSAVRGGIYHFDEPSEFDISPNFMERYRPVLFSVRSVGMNDIAIDNPLRRRYLLVEALGARGADSLADEQKLSYSAVLLRRKKYAEAIAFLMPLTRAHPDSFFFDCHLALAFHRSGELQRAVDTLQPVFERAWPEDWDKLKPHFKEAMIRSGWNEGLYKFYRDTEKLYLKLLRSRLAEWRRNRGKEAEFQSVDPLFEDAANQPIRYVDMAGKFAPGDLAPAEKAKLPPNAIDMVRQLLLWLPDDPRLYWQLGELYAALGTEGAVGAQGDRLKQMNLTAAKQIFNELVQDFNLRIPDLQERRHLLNGLKGLNQESSLEDFETKINQVERPPPVRDDPSPFAWRPFGVGMLSGCVLCVFLYWQVREFRRRRGA